MAQSGALRFANLIDEKQNKTARRLAMAPRGFWIAGWRSGSASDSVGMIMNYKFRKKPVVIEAFQMTPERRVDNRDWPEWMNRAWNKERGEEGALYPTEAGTGDGTISIGTLEGPLLVSWGDYIIQGVKGEIYPCKPDIFEATYDKSD